MSQRRYPRVTAWAEKLQSSPGLMFALRSPPAFGELRIKHEDARDIPSTKPGEDGMDQFAEDLMGLVAKGIPTALQLSPATSFESRMEDKEIGIAFEGTNNELGCLDDVTTAIPRVEVGLLKRQSKQI